MAKFRRQKSNTSDGCQTSRKDNNHTWIWRVALRAFCWDKLRTVTIGNEGIRRRQGCKNRHKPVVANGIRTFRSEQDTRLLRWDSKLPKRPHCNKIPCRGRTVRLHRIRFATWHKLQGRFLLSRWFRGASRNVSSRLRGIPMGNECRRGCHQNDKGSLRQAHSTARLRTRADDEALPHIPYCRRNASSGDHIPEQQGLRRHIAAATHNTQQLPRRHSQICR